MGKVGRTDTPFEPSLHYERDFDPTNKSEKYTMAVEFTRAIRVERVADDGTRSMVPLEIIIQNQEEILVFQGESLEELLYNIDQFNNKTKYMKLTAEQKWEEWPRIQGHGPIKVWNNLQDTYTYDITARVLEEAMKDFIKNWAKDSRAKDTMLKNIKREFRKPMGADVHEHHVRFDLLMDYIDLLPSTEITTKITEVEKKDFFFETFPTNWRQELVIGSRVDFYKATVEDIKQFMMMKKKSADAEDNKK